MLFRSSFPAACAIPETAERQAAAVAARPRVRMDGLNDIVGCIIASPPTVATQNGEMAIHLRTGGRGRRGASPGCTRSPPGSPRPERPLAGGNLLRFFRFPPLPLRDAGNRERISRTRMDTPIVPISRAEPCAFRVAASPRANPCVCSRAKPGRAASPFAAGCRNGPSDDVGCAYAVRPERTGNMRPRISGAFCRHSWRRRAGTARPTQPSAWKNTRFFVTTPSGKPECPSALQGRIQERPSAPER